MMITLATMPNNANAAEEFGLTLLADNFRIQHERKSIVLWIGVAISSLFMFIFTVSTALGSNPTIIEIIAFVQTVSHPSRHPKISADF